MSGPGIGGSTPSWMQELIEAQDPAEPDVVGREPEAELEPEPEGGAQPAGRSIEDILAEQSRHLESIAGRAAQQNQPAPEPETPFYERFEYRAPEDLDVDENMGRLLGEFGKQLLQAGATEYQRAQQAQAQAYQRAQAEQARTAQAVSKVWSEHYSDLDGVPQEVKSLVETELGQDPALRQLPIEQQVHAYGNRLRALATKFGMLNQGGPAAARSTRTAAGAGGGARSGSRPAGEGTVSPTESTIDALMRTARR